MTSATGEISRLARRQQGGSGLVSPKLAKASEGGFTLLEILVVIALLGLMSAVLIGGTDRLLAPKNKDLEDMALGAIARARQDAVATGQTVALKADQIGRERTGSEKKAAPENGVHFLPVAMESASLIGGQLREQPLVVVRFYADGTCDPFRVELSGQVATRTLTIDPWTCVVLAPGKAASLR